MYSARRHHVSGLTTRTVLQRSAIFYSQEELTGRVAGPLAAADEVPNSSSEWALCSSCAEKIGKRWTNSRRMKNVASEVRILPLNYSVMTLQTLQLRQTDEALWKESRQSIGLMTMRCSPNQSFDCYWLLVKPQPGIWLKPLVFYECEWMTNEINI